MFRYFIPLLICLLNVSIAHGQFSEEIILRNQSKILDDYIQLGLNNNLSILQSQINLLKQEKNLEQAALYWNPTAGFNFSYLLAEGGRTIVFPVGDLFNPAYGAINQLRGDNAFPRTSKSGRNTNSFLKK